MGRPVGPLLRDRLAGGTVPAATVPAWQVLGVLAAAPALEALPLIVPGVSVRTVVRFAFLPGMITEYLLAAVVVLSLRRAGDGLASVGVSTDGWRREALVGLGLGLGFWVLFPITDWVAGQLLPRTAAYAWEGRPAWAAVVFAVAVVTAFAPIQELVWRGYAIGGLQRHVGFPGAVAVQAVAFGLYHWWGGPALVASTTVFGVVYALVYRWRGSLVAPVVSHLLNDLPAVAYAFWVTLG